LNMADKYCAAAVPSAGSRDLLNALLEDLKPMDVHLGHLQFHQALSTILKAVDRVNGYIEEKAPWKLAKTSQSETEAVLREVLLCLKALAFYLWPFLPESAQTIWAQLGEKEDLAASAKDFFLQGRAVDLAAGQPIRKGSPLFPRK